VLLELVTESGARLALRVPTKVREKVRYVFESIAPLCQPQEKLVIHGVVETVIDQVPLIYHTAAEERSGAGDIKHAVVPEDEVTKINLAANLKDATVLVNPCIVTVNKVNFRKPSECLEDCLEASRPIPVVGVEPPDYVAGRQLEAFVERVALAMIWLRDPTEMLPPWQRLATR
jgi:hypothetical protein